MKLFVILISVFIGITLFLIGINIYNNNHKDKIVLFHEGFYNNESDNNSSNYLKFINFTIEPIIYNYPEYNGFTCGKNYTVFINESFFGCKKRGIK